MKFFPILFLVSTLVYSQNNFDNGFREGYKQGYCYNQKLGCIDPIPPISPVPTINENVNSYQDGYNRGFQSGLASKSNTDERKRYTTSQPNFVDFIENNNSKNLAVMLEILKLKKNSSYSNFSELDYERNLKKLQKILDTDVIAREQLKGLKTYNYKAQEILDKIQSEVSTLRYKEQVAQNTEYLTKTEEFMLNLRDFLAKTLQMEWSEKIQEGISQRNFEAVDKELENSISLMKMMIEPDKEELFTYESLRTQSKFEQGDMQEAIISATNAINLSSGISYDMYLYRGLAYAQINKFQKSNDDYLFLINNFSKTGTSTSELATLYNNLGYNQIKTNNLSEGKKNIEKALILDENLPFIWDSKGELQFLEKDFSNSIKSMTKAISLDPTASNSYYIRGLSYLQNDNLKEGCADLGKAISLNPKTNNKEFQKKCI